jgi:hypothetical protein
MLDRHLFRAHNARMVPMGDIFLQVSMFDDTIATSTHFTFFSLVHTGR